MTKEFGFKLWRMLTSTAWCWLSARKDKKNLSEKVKKI